MKYHYSITDFVDSIPVRNGFFGNASVPLLLDNVICRGTETHLLQCAHNGLRNHNCDSLETAGVQCEGELN